MPVHDSGVVLESDTADGLVSRGHHLLETGGGSMVVREVVMLCGECITMVNRWVFLLNLKELSGGVEKGGEMQLKGVVLATTSLYDTYHVNFA